MTVAGLIALGGLLKSYRLESKILSLKNSSEINLQPININKASSFELEELNGIGPALAFRIVAYRKEEGDFLNLEELAKVKGLGPKKIAKFKNQIVFK